MILFALVIVAILFFMSWNLFLSNRWVHITTSLISSLLLLATIGFSIANFNQHYGMHLVNHTHTEKLASMSPKQSMLVYEKVGSAKKHEIVAYRSTNNGSVKHTNPDVSVKNRIVTTKSAKPSLKVTHRQWSYRSNAARDWFGLAMKHQTKSTVNTFYVPKSWIVLSASQAKVMKQSAKKIALNNKHQMNSQQAKSMLKQKAQAYVQAKMMKAMQKDPKMTASQKKAVMKQAMHEFKNQMKRKAMQKIMKQVLAKAKTAPEGYVAK